MSTDCVTPMNCGEGKDFGLHAGEQCGIMWRCYSTSLLRVRTLMQGFVNSKSEQGLFNKHSENNVTLSSRPCKCAHIYMHKREKVDECMHVCAPQRKHSGVELTIKWPLSSVRSNQICLCFQAARGPTPTYSKYSMVDNVCVN